MSTTLSGAFAKITLSGTESTTIGSSARQMPISTTFQGNLANGTSLSAAQAICVASITGNVTAGTPVSINLANLTGAGVDDPLVLTSVKSILIQNLGSSGNLTLGSNLLVGDITGATSHIWSNLFGVATGQDIVEPGGTTAKHSPLAGFAVTSTNGILLLASSVGTIQYQVDILGVK